MTIPDGQLPLPPKLTPGWGVAGTVLIITGAIYALVGIKNRWIHTFFSTAYVASLGVAVLIVYVMDVPISNALQGGYVAAAILSGCALGTASVFFKELTEGLGCALGGFCVSMWLLCLVPGGLLKPVPAKAIFISCFTLVGFAFYFSRYTRDWALISMISFAGATVVVLGIDCFSRAGLKEFWAYIWELNDSLFPLGADTYPVTKGIRVETAATIIIFLVSIISQIKLWKIVREKRKKRAAERAEEQRNLEQEEADVGRQVEEANDRDRREWERVYGDGDPGSSTGSSVSKEDANNEKKLTDSERPVSDGEVIEMTDMTDSDRGQVSAPPLAEKDEDGKVIVRVAADDVPEGVGENEGRDGEEDTTIAYSESKKRASSFEQSRRSHTTVSGPPEVVPLPFKVPEVEDDAKSHSERSSVATFADDDGKAEEPTRRASFAKRLSRGSSRLLRNLSPISARHVKSASSIGEGESSDELVTPKAGRSDDESSVVATLDGQSQDCSARHSMLAAERGMDIEISARLADGDDGKDIRTPARNSLAGDGKTEENIVSVDAAAPGTGTSQVVPETPHRAGDAELSLRSPSEKPKSATSAASTPASLTKDRLPRSLSRVALSYRTNEWAKHLSYADTPEPDELRIAEGPKPKKKSDKEQPAPVKIEELQQGAEEGVPAAAALPRPDSFASNTSLHRVVSKRDSRTASSPNLTTMAGIAPLAKDQAGVNLPRTQVHALGVPRSSSAMVLSRPSSSFDPIAEEHGMASKPNAMAEGADYSRPISMGRSLSGADPAHRVSTPGVVSYSNPQTLLGQREAFLRSKSQGNLSSPPPDPSTMVTRPPSMAGSISNYPIYAAALTTDPDDIPLSQRKQMMRHNSLISAPSNSQPIHPSPSATTLAETSKFDSHQPKRESGVPNQAAREAKLAQFRTSVAMDLGAGTPMITSSGRETPFASTNGTLLGGRDAEVQRSIQAQRNMLLGQKEAEAQRKEMQRREKEWVDRAFDERMRNGELLEAHREAMRRMQQGVKKSS